MTSDGLTTVSSEFDPKETMVRLKTEVDLRRLIATAMMSIAIPSTIPRRMGPTR